MSELFTKNKLSLSAELIPFLIFCTLILIQFFNYFSNNIIFAITHDFLDSNFVIWSISDTFNNFLNFEASVDSLMGGIPLSMLALNDFDFFIHLYGLINPLTAFGVQQIFFRIIAYIGMYLLLTRILNFDSINLKIAASISAFYFAMLPIWPSVISSVVVLPLVIFSVLILRKDLRSVTAWVGLALSAIYTGLPTTGFYILPLLGGLILFDFIKNQKKINSLIATIIFLFFFTMGNIRIIYSQIFISVPSHRDSWPVKPAIDWNQTTSLISNSIGLLKHGHYHFYSLHYSPVAVLIFLILLKITMSKKFYINKNLTNIAFLILIVTFVSIFSAVQISGLINLGQVLGLPFNFSRIYSLLPFLWALILALALREILESYTKYKEVILGTVGILVFFQSIWFDSGFVPKLNYQLRGSEFTASTPGFGSINIQSHFDIENFKTIKNRLEGETENPVVVSIGLDPMIAAFNGLNTLDGYSYNYPLDHKYNFRKIIQRELEKDENLRSYYDDWGSRVYMFYSDPLTVDFDFCAAQNLGATHAISTIDIRQYQVQKTFSVDRYEIYDVKKICESAKNFRANL